jgi:hypothetical protein
MIDPKKNGIVKLIVRVLSIWHTFKVRLRSEQGKTIIRCTYSNIFGSILANGTFIPIAILLIFPAMIFIPEPPGQMIKPALFTMLSFFFCLWVIPDILTYITSYKIVTDYLEVALQAKRVPK